MASGRTPAVEAVVSGLEDVVCIPLLATNGHPATTVRLPRWRSQEGPEGAVWIRWAEVRDDLLKKYAEASGLTWTFPPVPGALREALKCLPRGAEKEAESLERVWDSSNKKGTALSRVALSFVLQRYDVDAAVMRAVTDAIDREGLPLSQTAPQDGMDDVSRLAAAGGGEHSAEEMIDVAIGAAGTPALVAELARRGVYVEDEKPRKKKQSKKQSVYVEDEKPRKEQSKKQSKKRAPRQEEEEDLAKKRQSKRRKQLKKLKQQAMEQRTAEEEVQKKTEEDQQPVQKQARSDRRQARGGEGAGDDTPPLASPASTNSYVLGSSDNAALAQVANAEAPARASESANAEAPSAAATSPHVAPLGGTTTTTPQAPLATL